jgi:predicted lipid-binding transport protein (Tim44 family)
MKRSLALICLLVMALAPVLIVTDAWARAGGGSSSGSRGSRSYSSPAKPAPSPVSPARPSSPVSPAQPQRSGWGAGIMGGLAGFALGGLLGSMLFGGGMGGGFGGLGLLEMLLIGGGIFLLFRMFRNRQSQPAPAYGQGAGGPSWQSPSQAQTQAYDTAPAAPMATAASDDLDRGLSYIRQMDGGFDAARFSDQASDIFFKVQAAWMQREMRSASAVLTPDMADTMQKDCDRLRSQGRINRLENIAVRSVTPTEAWQEGGQDFLTVCFLASLLDYTVEESSGQVVDGSRSEPVKFEEYWTFTRPVGPNVWRLSAIQQA